MGRVSSCFSASSRPFLPDIGFPFKRCRAKISQSIQRAYPTPPIIDSAPGFADFFLNPESELATFITKDAFCLRLPYLSSDFAIVSLGLLPAISCLWPGAVIKTKSGIEPIIIIVIAFFQQQIHSQEPMPYCFSGMLQGWHNTKEDDSKPSLIDKLNHGKHLNQTEAGASRMRMKSLQSRSQQKLRLPQRTVARFELTYPRGFRVSSNFTGKMQDSNPRIPSKVIQCCHLRLAFNAISKVIDESPGKVFDHSSSSPRRLLASILNRPDSREQVRWLLVWLLTFLIRHDNNSNSTSILSRAREGHRDPARILLLGIRSPPYRDELIDSSDPRSGLTGLEPAASALTGRCSDRLNYNPRKINKESIAIPFFHRERFIPSHKSHFSLFFYGNAMQEVSEIGLFLMMKTRYLKVGNVRRRLSVSDGK
ncbi:hypothetical protein VNO78_35171 [Psophocarpus tetragonolobus]|uniref:Uncharacterized protein n=1 Tax=Psophocarpus tetragonolobus TaxID=3891 RepID=A0AAN9RR62_PSOTE